jgi:3-isopropylmalate/(R)-2-methylmalate dehydratase small subunit
MQKFEKLTGLVVPLDRSNVDTDAIIPKQFLKSIHRTGFGPNLFDAWRYLDHGELGMDNSKRPLNPDFVLNDERYQGAQILIARANFGCGSSREHAVWSLQDYGIRVVVAPSFADIFCNNCCKNGMLPVVLEENVMDQLFKETEARPGYSLDIDLPAQTVTTPDGDVFKFDVDGFRKRCLLDGLDDIDLTLRHRQDIEAYEQRRRSEALWLFP